LAVSRFENMAFLRHFTLLLSGYFTFGILVILRYKYPRAKNVTTKPWGAQEFAILGKTGVCVIFRQWST
jgi:hypothetical protein